MVAFNVIDRADDRVVSVFGDIDVSNAEAFEAACSDRVNEGPVIVDLLSCPYIDSTGLTALIKANRRNPITLVLSPECRIYRVFALTDLIDYFKVVRTIDQAPVLGGLLHAPQIAVVASSA